MERLTLADELILLAYDDHGASHVPLLTLDYGLAGAVLIELTLADRIGVLKEHVILTDPSPVGNPVLDDALDRIAAEPRPRLPKHWVDKLHPHLRDRVLDGLVSAGVLERERDRVLWLFPRTRYPFPHGEEPPAEADARHRLVAAIHADGQVETRTAALCALVRAVELERQVFADLPRDRVKARLDEIVNGDWAVAATKMAIAEVQTAVMLAVIAPAIGASAANA